MPSHAAAHAAAHGAKPSPATVPDPARRPELQAVLPPGHVELHGCAFAFHVAEDGTVELPEWVQLTPAGEDEGGEAVVRGRDGRRFTIDDPKLVLEGTELPIQFDWEHRSMYSAIWGGSTRAAGWIDRIEYLDKGDTDRPEPGFWGHVERWTAEGRADVEGGYFRGLSPLVRYQYREPKREGDEAPPPLLRGFVNVALTNLPNLRMTLLHSEQPPGVPAPSPAPPTTTRPQAFVELEAAIAAAGVSVPPEVHWPAFYVLAPLLGDVLTASEAAAHYGRCQSPADVEALRAHLKHAPHAPTPPGPRPTPPASPSGLTPHQRRLAHDLGLSEAEYAAALPPEQRPAPAPPSSGPVLTPHQREIARRLGTTEAEYTAALDPGPASPPADRSRRTMANHLHAAGIADLDTIRAEVAHEEAERERHAEDLERDQRQQAEFHAQLHRQQVEAQARRGG